MQGFERIKRNMLPDCLRDSMFVGECLLIYGDIRNGNCSHSWNHWTSRNPNCCCALETIHSHQNGSWDLSAPNGYTQIGHRTDCWTKRNDSSENDRRWTILYSYNGTAVVPIGTIEQKLLFSQFENGCSYSRCCWPNLTNRSCCSHYSSLTKNYCSTCQHLLSQIGYKKFILVYKLCGSREMCESEQVSGKKRREYVSF